MFVVIGTVTADLLVKSETSLVNLGGDGFRSSNLVFTDTPLNITMGGNGGNCAYVLAGLGAPTALCGAVGRDLLGGTLVRWLEDRNVNLDGLTRSATHATSTSTIIMTDTANQVVFHHLGSTTQARYEHIPDSLFLNAKALLISSYPIMTGMRPGGFDRAIARVHEAGGITAMDLGPAIGEPVTLEEITPLLPNIDFLIANSHELASLIGVSDWKKAVEKVLAAGAKRVVIKQGERGASIWASQDRIHVPAFEIKANITVGAGDSFNAGLLYALGEEWSLIKSLRFGNAVAAMVVADEKGILNSPTFAQVMAFLNSKPGSNYPTL